jgi:hypothetical protein
MLSEDRRECARHADRSEYVGVELGSDVAERRSKDRRVEVYARVVYDDRYVWRRLSGRDHRLVVGDVNGLLEREDYREPGQRTRQRYRLTEKCADLFPVLVALMQWGDRWLDESGGPVEMRHRDCGERVGVELRCAAGHSVDSYDLDLAARRPR